MSTKRPFQFLATLPSGYDDRTRMTLGPNNSIVILHPEHSPLIYDEQTHCFEPIDVVHVQEAHYATLPI